MTPVNNKSLLHFIFDQMEKLDKGDISVDVAKSQAALSKQANNVLRYELDRANLMMKISYHNREFNDKVQLRETEGKNFE